MRACVRAGVPTLLSHEESQLHHNTVMVLWYIVDIHFVVVEN